MAKGSNIKIPFVPKTKIVKTFQTSVGRDDVGKITGKPTKK